MDKSIQKLSDILLELNNSVKELALSFSGNLRENMDSNSIKNEELIMSKYTEYLNNPESKLCVHEVFSDIYNKSNQQNIKNFSEKNNSVHDSGI